MSHYIDTPGRQPPNKQLIGDVSGDYTIERLRLAKQARAQEEADRKNNYAKMNTNSGVPTITSAALVASALTNGGYEIPGLNNKLYLHFKGYRKIERLDEYVNVKTLFLESNGIMKIENLDKLVNVTSLHLQQNCIEVIENLGCLENLVSLNLSQNNIRVVDGLGNLPYLKTLNLSKNFIEDKSDIEHLEACQSIVQLDISTNKLHELECVEVFASMKNIAHLKLEGNPFVSKVRHYRKTFINKIPKLVYLDRPVFEVDRRSAVAWKEAGECNKAERDAKQAYHQEEKNKEKESMRKYREWKRQIQQKKLREMEAAGVTPYNQRPAEQREVDDQEGLQQAMERSYDIYGKPEDEARQASMEEEYAGGIGWDGPKKAQPTSGGTLLMQRKREAEAKKQLLNGTMGDAGGEDQGSVMIEELTAEEEHEMKELVKKPGGIEELGRRHAMAAGVQFDADGQVVSNPPPPPTADAGAPPPLEEVNKGADVENWERIEGIKAEEAKQAAEQTERCERLLEERKKKVQAAQLTKERRERERTAKVEKARQIAAAVEAALTPEQRKQKEETEARREREREARRREEEEEDARHARVEESLRIYNEQRALDAERKQMAVERAEEKRQREERERQERQWEQEAEDEDEDWASQRRRAKGGGGGGGGGPPEKTERSEKAPGLAVVRSEAEHDYKMMSRRARGGKGGNGSYGGGSSTWDKGAPATFVPRAVLTPAAPPPPPAAKLAAVVKEAATVDWSSTEMQKQLEQAVRASAFDFGTVAADLSASTGVEISADVCRMEFAKIAKGKRAKPDSTKPAREATAAKQTSKVTDQITVTPPPAAEPATSPSPEFTDMSELD